MSLISRNSPDEGLLRAARAIGELEAEVKRLKKELKSASSAERTLRAIFRHWNEFGPECGFGELMDRAQDSFPPADEETGK